MLEGYTPDSITASLIILNMHSHRKKTKIQNSADRIKKDIIVWLLGGGMSFDPANDSVGNEVLFSRRRRRADLLILSNTLHALEIKGNADRLTKLSEQLEDYCKTFDKVSVVVTKKHLVNVKTMLPRSVGLILIEDEQITILREPHINRRLSKASLLMFLNKKLLAGLLQTKVSRLLTGELRQQAETKKSINAIRECAYAHLREVYTKLFQRFMRETQGYPIQMDEIRALSVEVSSIHHSESNGEV